MALTRSVAAFVVLTAGLLLAVGRFGSDNNTTVQEYYTSLESRFGYRLLLGDARHCGLWIPGTIWPFPIGNAQLAMEEFLFHRLGLKSGSRVLDAGAGSGIVASYMAERGLRVHAVDLTPIYVEKAKRNVKAQGLDGKVLVDQADYHELFDFRRGAFHGIYTMEAFVHAYDPDRALQNFFRLLRPGGVLVLHEVDYRADSRPLEQALRSSHRHNSLGEGAYEKMLARTGFQDITIEDLSDRVFPMWRLFGILGAIPYDALSLFGLQERFPDMMAGVETYRSWGQVRYISVRAVKPQ